MTAQHPDLSVRLAGCIGRLSLDVEFCTPRGQTTVVVGPNGAGKTSLLRALLGLVPVRGRVVVGDAVLMDSERGVSVPIEQRRLGYVPQDYALLPHLSVRQNVQLAVRCAGGGVTLQTQRVETALADLGVSHLADRFPGGLSGGERQRVALARAISVQPKALLMDEPLAALDVHSRREVRQFLAETLKRLELPAVVVSHDPVDALELGQSIVVMEAGRVVQSGASWELSSRPGSAFVREFTHGWEPTHEAGPDSAERAGG